MGRPRVVIVGAGFAGYHAARKLARRARGRADIVLVNPTDYFLYLPPLPEVATGILEPRHCTVSIPNTLPGVRLLLAEAHSLDIQRRRLSYVDPEGGHGQLEYDRLVLAAGSVNRLLPIPGIAEHAHGFRGLPEALYLRDHLTRQLELAAATPDPDERRDRLTFVVVGAGYTGVEVCAHGQLFTDTIARRLPGLAGEQPRWLLLDIAERVLPELDPRLSANADRVLRERGVEVRTRTSVQEAMREGVRLNDGQFIGTRSLIWCVGVRPDPFVDSLGLPTNKGRVVVDEYLSVPDHREIYACGDAAAVPDLTRPGEITPMTAQHAERQGKLVAVNIAASYGQGVRRRYRHKDLGFVVDLGDGAAAANPLGVPLAGRPAKLVTRGYHLLSVPAGRSRIAIDWLLDATMPRQIVQVGLVRAPGVPLDTSSPELPVPHSHHG